MTTHLAQRETTLAMCVKVTLANATVYGFTACDIDLVVDGVTYVSQLGVTPSAFSAGSDTAPGTGELSGFFGVTGVVWNDVLSGKFNSAIAEVFLVNYADITMGKIPISEGPVGEIKRQGHAYMFECKDWRDLLTLNIGEATSPGCRVKRLGDTRCGVRVKPPAWAATTAYAVTNLNDAKIGSVVKPTTPNARFFRCTTAGTSGGSQPAWNTTIGGTTADGSVVWTTIQAHTLPGSVTGVISPRVFTDTARTEAGNFFKYGIVLWLTGGNAGTEWEVKANTGTQIDLFLSTRPGIQIGDTYEITRGCDRTLATCKTAFGNIYNNRSEPHKSSVNALFQYSTR